MQRRESSVDVSCSWRSKLKFGKLRWRLRKARISSEDGVTVAAAATAVDVKAMEAKEGAFEGRESETVACGEARGRVCCSLDGGGKKITPLADERAGAGGVRTVGELQRVVSGLRDGRKEAIEEAGRLARDDPLARTTLALLGGIPLLISMLDDPDPNTQFAALLALLHLATANPTNKAVIVKGRAAPKMAALLNSPQPDVQSAAACAFLSLSASAVNKAAIGASGAVPRLVRLLTADHARKDALRALYNLSVHPANVVAIVDAGALPLLLAMVEDVDVAPKALATLGHMAATEAGRRAMVRHKEMAAAVLVDALRWAAAPKCQERAAYVLMMAAQHGRPQREAMLAAGAVPALLEVVLLGTPLAQRRASRALESLRQASRLAAFSAPQKIPSTAPECSACQATAADERKVVERLARQSLQCTMRRIVKRANLNDGSVFFVVGDRRSSRF